MNRKLRFACSAIFAMCSMLLMPLAALACGGFFTPGTPLDQNIERIIFAAAPGSMTVYEQINYTGSASDFAWVLPVPSVPKLDTAPVSTFRSLDQQTVPRFIGPEPPQCGLSPLGPRPVGSGAPPPTGVNVYGSGAVGPYAYDVIGSSDPTALTRWLLGHHYNIPDQVQPAIQSYTQAHMLFLAMRLQPQAGVQDIQPVKVTFATTQPQVMIPLRMAASSAMPHMGILVWIFGSGRFVPQNYQPLQIRKDQIALDPYAGANYEQLVENAASQANGHGFITEYAQPSSRLYTHSDPTLAGLQQHYSYVTRLYTRTSPEQMTLDPIFAAQSGLPNVNNVYDLSNEPAPTTCDPFNLFLGSLGQLIYLAALLVMLGLVVGGVVLIRRRVSSS
jgi:hypothetical protein